MAPGGDGSGKHLADRCRTHSHGLRGAAPPTWVDLSVDELDALTGHLGGFVAKDHAAPVVLVEAVEEGAGVGEGVFVGADHG
jgi:hypothetical protein